MKICLVRDYTAPAKNEMGAERVVENLAKALLQLGHEVVMKLNPDSTEAPAPLVSEIPKDCDIIHFNQWDPKDNHDSYGIPWVASIYGGGMEQDPAWLARTNANPHIVCQSKFVADRVNCKAYVWTYSDPADFIFSEEKDDYFLWMAGTDWGEGKGIFTTIEYAKKLRINLKIAGSGKRQDIIDYIKSLCDDKIQFVGPKNGKEKAELFSRARGFILLTKLPDACPTTVGEAMLSGTPVIGSPNGSMPELIVDGYNGYICKTGADFAKAVLNLKYGKQVTPRNCYEYGLKHMSHISGAKMYLRHYENMINYRNVNGG